MGRLCVITMALVLPLALVAGCAGQEEPVTLGVVGEEVGALDAFADTAGAPVGVYEWFQAWEGNAAFDAARATAAAERGALPLLTWEPWAPGGGPEQPRYALARIADGTHDAHIADFARQVRAWGGRLGLRFMHEMNADWYPWGQGVNGNSAEDAVAAWEHVREVFADEGVEDVVWFWCVNVHAPGLAPYEPLFPGDDAVDWVAVDGYNGGDALPWGGWRTPAQVFGPSLEDLADLSDRPLAITEVGSAEEGGDKAAWIASLFELAVERGVRAVVWFELDKEADWRVESSTEARTAFRRAVDVPGRLGPFPS